MGAIQRRGICIDELIWYHAPDIQSFLFPARDPFPFQRRSRNESLPRRNQRCCSSTLFLCGRSLLLLGLGTLLALAKVASVGTGIAKLAEGVLGLRVVGDLALLDGDLVVDGEGLVAELDLAVVGVLADLACGLDLLGWGIAVLWRLDLAREEDETLLVGLQALDVGLEGLLGQVLAAWVDGDTDGWRKLAGNASLLYTIYQTLSPIPSFFFLSVPSTQRGRNHDQRAHGGCT